MHAAAPTPTPTSRRFIRSIAAALAALLAATALALTPTAPAKAAPGLDPIVDMPINRDLGETLIFWEYDYHFLGTHPDDPLPPGTELRFPEAGPSIAGTPTEAGIFPVRFTLEDAQSGRVFEQTFQFRVADHIAWQTGSLPSGASGVPYETTLEVTPWADFSVVGGALPTGLTLSPAGTISGTPSVDGPFTFTIRAANMLSVQDRAFTLDLDPPAPAPVWTTTELAPMQVGEPTTTTLQASDATSYRVTAGALPPGLAIEGDTVTGTPTQHGPYDVTITASHAGAETAQQFTGTVAAANVSWVTADVGPFAIGDAVDVQLEATNAVIYTLWGAGVPGLTLESNGRLHGTVTQSGTFPFSVEAVNADGVGSSKSFITVVRAIPVWVGETAVTVTAGEFVDLPNASVTGGSMQSVAVDPDGVASAEIRGRFGLRITGVAEGTATVTVTLTNNVHEYQQDVEITVLPRPTWLTTSLGDLRVDTPVELTLDAPGATSFEITDGDLPAGVTLADGVLTGTPTQHGPYDVTIAASNGDVETEQRFTGAVEAGIVSWVTPEIPDATVGYAVDLQLEATHAVQFVLEQGDLPEGLTLEPNGRLHGTPTQVESVYAYIRGVNADGEGVMRPFTVTVRAVATWVDTMTFELAAGEDLNVERDAVAGGWLTEATVAPDGIVTAEVLADTSLQLDALAPGAATVTVTFTNGLREWTEDLSVTVRERPTWVTESLGELREGVPFSVRLDATNATGFAVTGGELPAGLILDDGVLVGTPETFGPYDVTIAATNGGLQVEQRFTGEVSAAFVEWATESFPTLDRNVAAELPLEAANALAFELTDGTLPAGVDLVQTDAGWALAGTPAEAGEFAFELTAVNATGDPAPRAFELVVARPELTLAFAGEPGDEASGVSVGADGSGLAPSSGWSLVLFSESIEIASGEASAVGSIAASAKLPANVPFGAHELRFAATGADGVDVSTSVWFSVGEDGRIVEVSTGGPVTEPARTPAPAPAPTPAAQDGTIAQTGVEASGWILAALMLALAGLAGVAFARRRRAA
jgi:LPXTG-motif cell wall-anchored protein